MSKRGLGNWLKRKIGLGTKSKKISNSERLLMRSQLSQMRRLGTNVVVMRMGGR